MPKGSGGKSRVKGGSTAHQTRARAPKGSSGSPGGEKTRTLMSPKGYKKTGRSAKRRRSSRGGY